MKKPKADAFNLEAGERLSNVLQAVFEQGKSAQRMEDAQADFNIDTEDAMKEIKSFTEWLSRPAAKDVN